MPVIFLIRHGESRSNAGLPTLRPEDVTLTNLGIDQAACIAEYLAHEVSPDLIVTSSYKRTKQTAVPTKLRFPQVPGEVWPVQEFTYLSSEEFRGPTTVQDRKPLVKAYWELCDPKFVDGPGSESFEQLIVRAYESLMRFEKFDADKTVAVFSHEQFICAVYWLIEREPARLTSEAMRDFKEFLSEHSIPNGGFLRLQRPDARYPWQCELKFPFLAVSV